MKHKRNRRVSWLVLVVLLLSALVITAVSGSISVNVNPQVILANSVVLCNISPALAVPTHSYGLPIPYITHFIGGACGYSPLITTAIFWLDYVLWALLLLVAWQVFRYALAARHD